MTLPTLLFTPSPVTRTEDQTHNYLRPHQSTLDTLRPPHQCSAKNEEDEFAIRLLNMFYVSEPQQHRILTISFPKKDRARMHPPNPPGRLESWHRRLSLKSQSWKFTVGISSSHHVTFPHRSSTACDRPCWIDLIATPFARVPTPDPIHSCISGDRLLSRLHSSHPNHKFLPC